MTTALLGNAIGVHALPAYTMGLFIVPLQTEFAWSRTSISAGIAVLTICTAIAAPLVGLLLGKVADRILVASGLVAGGVGFFALSAMGPSLGFFWSTMALMALFGCGCSTVTLSHLIVGSFERHRGTALGISLMGIGLSGALGPVLLGPVVADFGWRTAYVFLGITTLGAVPVVLGLLSFGEPPSHKQTEHGTKVHIARDGVFYRLLLAFSMIALAIGGVVVHFVPMLVDVGYSSRQAAGMAGILGVSLMLGRLLTGVVIDRIFAPRVASFLMSASAVGFVVLYFGSAAWLPFAAILVGLSLGAELDLIAYLVSRYFPRSAYGRVVGLLYSGFLAGVAVSPLLFAEIRDMVGSYSLGLLWAAALLFVSSGVFLSLPRFQNDVVAQLQLKSFKAA